ncbi:sensor histidine kinase [Ottowia sp. GY511]|uniref:Sensor histidine kinase n=2 Tax=Ottowia TaxID=219181 RepID=A0ABW4KWB8_9BURK|nr:sensor histidine kinase [Ottowia sp. GY511]
MNDFWRDATRHSLQVVAFCFGVAVLTTAIWPANSYWMHVINALCIGLITWAVIEFGRLPIPAKYCHPSVEGGVGWPKGWRGVGLATLGIAAGFLVGDPIGRWLSGDGYMRSADDGRLGLIITIAAGGVATLYFYMRGHAASLEASRNAAERDASEAHLRLLQSQLEPHMLFNTLATLRALIGIDPPAAQQMLDRINDYLRATLNASRSTAHPLSAEFARLDDYLNLMALRMGPRLRVTLVLPDALRDVPVPPLLLQPLVENAIRHGLEPRVQGGDLTVRAWAEGDRLQLEVADTGVGFVPAEVAPDRFGLTQVRERVATAYAGAGRVEWQSAPGTGTRVRLALPLAPAAGVGPGR